jgi:hypothetical protein
MTTRFSRVLVILEIRVFVPFLESLILAQGERWRRA